MTSVKIKFRKSTIRNREGVLYFQFIHNRKVKLVTSRFRLYPYEWDDCLSTVIIENTQDERKTYLQNLKNGLESEVQQIYELIAIIEKRNGYTVGELAEYYVTQSHNGYLFPFVRYRIKTLKEGLNILSDIHRLIG